MPASQNPPRGTTRRGGRAPPRRPHRAAAGGLEQPERLWQLVVLVHARTPYAASRRVRGCGFRCLRRIYGHARLDGSGSRVEAPAPRGEVVHGREEAPLLPFRESEVEEGSGSIKFEDPRMPEHMKIP